MLGEKLYSQYFSNIPLRTSNKRVKSYDGASIKPLGVMSVPVRHERKEFGCEFMVIRNGGQPLIGRNVLNELDFGFVLDSRNQLVKDRSFSEDFLGDGPREVPLVLIDGVECESNRSIEQDVQRQGAKSECKADSETSYGAMKGIVSSDTVLAQFNPASPMMASGWFQDRRQGVKSKWKTVCEPS